MSGAGCCEPHPARQTAGCRAALSHREREKRRRHAASKKECDLWERVGCGVVVGLGNYEVRAELTGFRTGDPQDNGLGRAAVRLRHQAVRPYPEFQPRILPVLDIQPPFPAL